MAFYKWIPLCVHHPDQNSFVVRSKLEKKKRISHDGRERWDSECHKLFDVNHRLNWTATSRNSFRCKAWNVLEVGNQREGGNVWDFSNLVWPAHLMSEDKVLFLETIRKRKLFNRKGMGQDQTFKIFYFFMNLYSWHFPFQNKRSNNVNIKSSSFITLSWAITSLAVGLSVNFPELNAPGSILTFKWEVELY